MLNLACPDWEDRLKSGWSLVPPLPLVEAEASRAVTIFNKLRLADVPGTPRLEDAAGDWFRDIVRALFGSVDASTGERLIRELFVLVPKKNSKTSYGALLMLTALLLNKRPNARFIMTAPTQDITELAFGQAAGAIKLDPVLDAKFWPRPHLKAIVHRQTNATLEIMSFDPTILTGQKPAGVLVDELHVVAKMSKAASAVRQLRGGMLAIPEAFLAFITTQSEEPPAGVFRAELMKARAIRDGRQQGSMLPVIYEFPEAMQRDRSAWSNPTNWPMVTPNAGRSITISRLVEEFATAQATGDEELRAWASQHLNVEIGIALHSDRWNGADYWEQAADPTLTLQSLIERCEVVLVGIDGGGLDDLLGLAALGRETGTRRWLLWSRAWAHTSVLERRKSEAPRLRDLEQAGDLRIVDDMDIAFGEAADVAAEIDAAGLLAEVDLDPMGVGAIIDALAERGIEGDDRVVGVPQGWQLNGAIKTTEVKLANGTFKHAGQALMAWAVGNAKAEPKGNAVTITKQTAGTAKIDPLIACFCAVARMSRNPEAMGGAFPADYELTVWA